MLAMAKWPDLSLRTKCLLLISFPAAATVFMFGVANLLTGRTAAAAARVNRALETSAQIQRLGRAETEISAAARGYFLTSDIGFIEQARAALSKFDRALHQILLLASADPVAQQRAAAIASMEHAREERLFGNAARFQNGELPPDQLRQEVNSVEQQLQKMQALLKLMEQDNARELERQSEYVRALHREQRTLLAMGLILGLAGGAGMTLLFARGITSRLGRLQRNATHLAKGAMPKDLPGRDEIGTLNGRLIQVYETLQRQKMGLENALHGIAEVDSDGSYTWLNKAYAEITGRSRDQGWGTILSTVQPEDWPGVEEAMAQMRLQGRAEVAARISKPNGRAGDVVLLFLAPSRAPESKFYVFVRDLWTVRRSDAALIQAKDAAVAAGRAKTEFLARISHDIRTPLNAILGSADLLSQTSLSFDQSEYVNMFQRNCRRLVALINDFLDFSRIEAGAIRIEKAPFRIRETVEDAVSTFRDAAARKGVGLAIEIDPAAPECALGDSLRIQQVLVNLLSNALKFTEQGRVDVNVKVMSAASARDKLRFEICDTGPGIALENQDKIFARFVQLPAQTSGQRGAGLGLTICRDLVDLMEGEIGVVSREGEGSTFYFNLPLEVVEATVPDSAVPIAAAMAPAGEMVHILVAEDTEDNRLLVDHYLRGEPVTLRFVSNGQEALEAVEGGEQFDLILMDIDMPVMDGYTATRRIRAWQEAQAAAHGLATPIIALSADAMQEAVAASIKAGCVAHVAKPIDRETLLKTIRRYASTQRTLRMTAVRHSAVASAVSEQVKALVPQYLASKERQIEEARAALAARDFGPIRRFGHNLKGTGRGYGFPRIEDLGREIEQAASQADAARLAEQLDALHQFVSDSAAAVNS